MSECPFVRYHIACKKLEMCWLRKTDKRTNGHWNYKTANYANYANLLVNKLNRFTLSGGILLVQNYQK